MRSKLGLAIMSLFVIPLISAYTWGGAGSPFDYFDNEWVKFTIVLVLLFFLIYYFVNKKTDNTPVSIIVGLGIALLLTIALTKRGILDGFLEETIVDWILIIAILFIIFFLFYKIAFKEDMYGDRHFSWIGFIALLIALAAIPLLINLEDFLPESIIYGPFGDFIELLQGASDIIFIGVALVIFYLVLRKIFRGGKRIAGGAWRGARGVGRAGKWAGRKAWGASKGMRQARASHKTAKIEAYKEKEARQKEKIEEIRRYKTKQEEEEAREKGKREKLIAEEKARKRAEHRDKIARMRLEKERNWVKRKGQTSGDQPKKDYQKRIARKEEGKQRYEERIEQERKRKEDHRRRQINRDIEKRKAREEDKRKRKAMEAESQKRIEALLETKELKKKKAEAEERAKAEDNRKRRELNQQVIRREAREKSKLEAARKKRQEHIEKREKRLPMHQGSVDKRLFKKYGVRRKKYKNKEKYPRE